MADFVVHRSDDYLEHHGVKGQKWGVRNYQNADGSLTAEGQARRQQEAQQTVDRYGQKTQHRIRRALLGGLKGIGATAGAGAAAVGGTTLAAYFGAGGTLASLNFGALGAVAASGAAVTLPLLGVAAVGGIAISAIRSGSQKKRVEAAQRYLDSVNIRG